MWEYLTNLLWGPWFDYFGYQRDIQPAKFQAYLKMESFLLKAIDGSCAKDEKDFSLENYHGDMQFDYLEAEKEVWKTIFRESKPTCFRDNQSTESTTEQ